MCCVTEGYANAKAYHTYSAPDATIQSKEGTYFHTNIPLFIVKSGAGFYLIKTEYTEFQAVRIFSTHFVSFVTIFWKKHP